MATFQENAVFVLDPLNGVIVGAAVLKNNVKSVSTSGGFLYILCDAKSKAIVRVVVHHSFVTMESETKRQLQSNQSTPCVSLNSSPIGSLESLVKDVDGGITTTADSPTRKGINKELSSKVVDEYKPCTQQADYCEDLVPRTVSSLSNLSRDTIPAVCITEPVSDREQTLDYSKSTPCDEKETTVSSISCSDQPEEKKCLPVVKPTLDILRVAGSTSNCTTTEQDKKEQEHPESMYTVCEDVREHSRRVRMSRSTEDDIVADSKSHRKRRKGKGKRISSATSNSIL